MNVPSKQQRHMFCGNRIWIKNQRCGLLSSKINKREIKRGSQVDRTHSQTWLDKGVGGLLQATSAVINNIKFNNCQLQGKFPVLHISSQHIQRIFTLAQLYVAVCAVQNNLSMLQRLIIQKSGVSFTSHHSCYCCFLTSVASAKKTLCFSRTVVNPFRQL